MSRFQLGSSNGSGSKDEAVPGKTKHVGEVIEWNNTGTFFISAKLADLKYQVYDACPRRNKGIICRRKLDEKKACPACGHTAKNPLVNMFLRVELEDLRDAETVQSATVFNWWAEKLIGLNARELTAMEAKDIDTALEAKLDQRVVVKVNVKEAKNNSYGDYDWAVANVWPVPATPGTTTTTNTSETSDQLQGHGRRRRHSDEAAEPDNEEEVDDQGANKNNKKNKKGQE